MKELTTGVTPDGEISEAMENLTSKANSDILVNLSPSYSLTSLPVNFQRFSWHRHRSSYSHSPFGFQPWNPFILTKIAPLLNFVRIFLLPLLLMNWVLNCIVISLMKNPLTLFKRKLFCARLLSLNLWSAKAPKASGLRLSISWNLINFPICESHLEWESHTDQSKKYGGKALLSH